MSAHAQRSQAERGFRTQVSIGLLSNIREAEPLLEQQASTGIATALGTGEADARVMLATQGRCQHMWNAAKPREGVYTILGTRSVRNFSRVRSKLGRVSTLLKYPRLSCTLP